MPRMYRNGVLYGGYYTSPAYDIAFESSGVTLLENVTNVQTAIEKLVDVIVEQQNTINQLKTDIAEIKESLNQ